MSPASSSYTIAARPSDVLSLRGAPAQARRSSFILSFKTPAILTASDLSARPPAQAVHNNPVNTSRLILVIWQYPMQP